jgi:hypothetical protein
LVGIRDLAITSFVGVLLPGILVHAKHPSRWVVGWLHAKNTTTSSVTQRAIDVIHNANFTLGASYHLLSAFVRSRVFARRPGTSR